jgi:hypothetical protein
MSFDIGGHSGSLRLLAPSQHDLFHNWTSFGSRDTLEMIANDMAFIEQRIKRRQGDYDGLSIPTDSSSYRSGKRAECELPELTKT